MHPSFDPEHLSSFDDPGIQALEGIEAEGIANMEYAIEQELAHLRSIECGVAVLSNFTKLLQQVRDEQIALRKEFARLVEIIGA